MKKSNHIDNKGNVQMIDIGNKAPTSRKAVASGHILLSKDALKSILQNENKKGDVLTIAQVAGIQAAKKTSQIIPLTHTLNIVAANIDFSIKPDRVECTSEIKCDSKTGVEIEAIHATQIALLTMYDMWKYIDKSMTISEVRLILKEGGKSGAYQAK